ncbi:E3 ubiquitin-protein ligase BRE1 [Sporobolomyces koalae]|uniref:E3 ubiquitin-protein ligase BRE1 n=1 Tax=Sporobolomyces koalae TaxID=500713 RepID=UPI003180FD90
MNGESSPGGPASAMPADSANRKRVTLADHAPSSKKLRLGSADLEDPREPDDDTSAEDLKLESFRKEAIYREMLAYKRQYQRTQTQLEQLRAERSTCEVRLSKVEIAWNLLVQEATMILPSTSNPNPSQNGNGRATSPALTNMELDDEELQEALSYRSSETKHLLQQLQALHHPSSDADQTTTISQLESKCRDLLDQSLKSQEALRLLRVSHETTLAELDATHTALLRAEKKFDRYQSRTVAALEGRDSTIQPNSAQASLNGNNGTVAGTGTREDGAASGKGKQPSTTTATMHAGQPDPETTTNQEEQAARSEATRTELEDLRDVVDKRGRELEDMRRERIKLKNEIDSLRVKLVDLPDEVVAESTTFRLMQTHVQYLSGEYETKRQEAERAVKEADGFREAMETFREDVIRESTEQLNELQARLASNESDLHRLRAARDDLKAETAEIKAKDTERSKTLEELKTLAESRTARMQVYQSEIKRMRIERAAKNGDLEGVEMRIDPGQQDRTEEDLTDDLRARLQTADKLLLALKGQLESYATSGNLPDGQRLVASETQARIELTKALEKLDKFEKVFGPDAASDPQIKELAQKLQERDQELKAAEAQVKSHEAASNMLYGEIDRLSAAWSALDEQNASKVFNLASLEDKLQRLGAEKAKADSRYFATMRQKDALTNENTVLTKLAEKQQQKVESVSELQHSLTQQLTAAEKEITLHQDNVRAYADQIAQLRRDNSEALLRTEQNSKKITELTSLLTERISQAENEQGLRKRAEEELAKVERQLQQAISKVATATAAAGPAADSSEIRELKKYNADLSKMLKCSTCNLRFKSVIINRCGHTFCKECVDARLANRQRKCPNCGGMFGRDDVGPVYF